MDFFKGVINTITQSDRKTQIKELCERIPTVHRIERGKYQLVLHCSNAQVSSMLVTVLDTFPNTKPILSVQGPLMHPWIDGYRFVTKCPSLNNWEGATSSLADVVLEVKASLESGYTARQDLPVPPKPAALLQRTLSPPIEGDYMLANHTGGSSEEVQLKQEPEIEVESTNFFSSQPVDIPTEFPKLKELTEAQLVRLLSDEVAFDAFRKAQCSDTEQGTSKLLKEFWIKNVERAEQNLEKEEGLRMLHKRVNDLQDLLQVDLRQYQTRVEEHTKKNFIRKEDIVANLREKADVLDMESEDMGSLFLSGDKPLGDFMKEYNDLRVKHHSIVAKLESATAAM